MKEHVLGYKQKGNIALHNSTVCHTNVSNFSSPLHDKNMYKSLVAGQERKETKINKQKLLAASK